MADGYDLVFRPNVQRRKSDVKRCRAVGHCASVRRADESGEFALEGGYFWTLRHPTG
jgi:hypothetical protein